MRTPRVSNSLRRAEDEGGAPMAHRLSRKRTSRSPRAGTSLYYFNIRTEHGTLYDDPEGLTLSDLKAALHEALALARDSLAEGHQNGKDRRGWRVEIMDRSNEHLLTVAFAEVPFVMAR